MSVTRPTDETVAELVELLNPDLNELFHERAGCREFLGGYSRSHAEAVALLDVLNRYPEALSGVTVFAIELDGTTHWIVTTDRSDMPSALTRGSIKAAPTPGVAEIVRKTFGGKALLSAVDPGVHV